MFIEYVHKALNKARYKKLENGAWFGEIPGFEGVWSHGSNIEKCRHELIEVLEEWLLLKVRDGDAIPSVDGSKIKIKKVA